MEAMLEFHGGELLLKDIGEAVRIYNDAYLGENFAFDDSIGGVGQSRVGNNPCDKQN